MFPCRSPLPLAVNVYIVATHLAKLHSLTSKAVEVRCKIGWYLVTLGHTSSVEWNESYHQVMIVTAFGIQ